MQRRVDVPDDQMVDVFAHLGPIAWRWPILVVAIGLGTVLAAGYTYAVTPLYRASMKLIVVPARMDRATGPTRIEPSIAEAYVPLVRNADSIRRAVASLHLDTADQRWKLARLNDRLSVTLSRQAPVLELSLDFPDPNEGRTLLDVIARQAVSLNAQLLQQSDADTRGILEARVTDARARLEQAQSALTKFHEASRITERQAQLDALVEARVQVKENLTNALTASSELDGKVAELTAALKQQDKIISLKRNVAEEPTAQSAAVRAGPGTPVQAEVINPLYEQVEPLLVEERGRLAANRAAAKQLAADIRATDVRISRLTEEVQRDQITVDRLRLDLEVAQDTYKALVAQYETARTAVTAQSADLKIFEVAQVSSTPVWPRLLPNLVFGAALGALAGLVLAAGLVFRERAFSGAPKSPTDQRIASV